MNIQRGTNALFQASETPKPRKANVLDHPHPQMLKGDFGNHHQQFDSESDEFQADSSPSPIHSLPFKYDILRLAHQMQSDLTFCGFVQDRRVHLKIYKDCFLHQDGLRWLVDRIVKLEQISSNTINSSRNIKSGRASFYASFTTMESYLEELKNKAARLGNLFIAAGYISHVTDSYQFSVSHTSKTLYFRFHPETIQRQQSVDRVRLPPTKYPGSLARSSREPRVKRGHNLQTDKEDDLDKDHRFLCKRSMSFSNGRPSLIVIKKNDSPQDALSVMSLLSHVSTASSGSKKGPLYNPNRIVDLGLLSLVRDLQNDMKFLKQIKDRIWHLILYRKCFLHDQAMEWLTRQTRIHYSFLREHGTDEEVDSIPLSLTNEQAQEIGARIGNLLIQHGYVSHVCSRHTFRASENAFLFFRFQNNFIDTDYTQVNLGQLKERDIEDFQNELFWRETRVVLAGGTTVITTSTSEETE